MLLEDFDIRSRYGSFEGVLSCSQPRSIVPPYASSSAENVPLKFYRIPVVRELSSSPCRSLSPDCFSFTLEGAPRSFDSIESDNSQRPQGQWYEFLQNFNPLVGGSREPIVGAIKEAERYACSCLSENDAPKRSNSRERSSPHSPEDDRCSLAESSDKNKKLRVDPSALVRASASSLPLEGTSSSVSLEPELPSQLSDAVASPKDDPPEALEASTSGSPSLVLGDSTLQTSLEGTHPSRRTNSEEDHIPEEPWSLAESSAENSPHHYSFDHLNKHEPMPLELRTSRRKHAGRKYAGRKKEKRVHSSPHTFNSSPRRDHEITEIEEEPEEHSVTALQPSYTYRTFPSNWRTSEADFLSEVLSWDVNTSPHEEAHRLQQDDSARASVVLEKQFDIIVSSSPTFPEEPEPDSALSFETRMAEAHRLGERRRDSSRSNARGFVRKVAGVSDGRRLHRVGRENKNKAQKTKPERS